METFMAKEWSVVSNSGEEVTLKRAAEVIRVQIPDEPTARKLFLKLVPPGIVTDDGLKMFIRSKTIKKPRRKRNPEE
jgi:hypothetical protein